MPNKQFPCYAGTRLTEAEMLGLQNLSQFVGRKQSDVLRFLIRTAAQRPQQVAQAMQHEAESEGEAPREPAS